MHLPPWLWPFRKRKKGKEEPKPFFWLTQKDYITELAGYAGWLFCGETGSGKTTTAERLARLYLRRGAGFCWVMAKPDEWERLQRLAIEEGRAQDLIHFAERDKWRFNFLEYLLSRPGGIDAAESVIEILVEVSSRQQAKGDEMFWKLACSRHLRNAVAAIWLAHGKASMDDVYSFLTTTANTRADLETQEWKEGFCAQTLKKLAHKECSRDVVICARYWGQEVLALSDRTLSTISTMAINLVAKFVTGPLAELICTTTNFTIDDILNGKILGIDTPILTYDEPGRFLALVMSVLTQKAVLARQVNAETLPTVLWRDEFQLFTAPELDMKVQTVSRSQKLVSVISFQSNPILYAALGGSEKARHEAHGLISSHVNKFIGAQSCVETCEYYSKLLGKIPRAMMNGNTQSSQPFDFVGECLGLTQPQATVGFSEQLQFDFPPEKWARLARGGPEHEFWVEMICHASGRRFSNGKHWIKCRFKQQLPGVNK